MIESLAEHLLRRWGAMDADFQRHSVVWKACFDATYPERADGLQGDVIDASSALPEPRITSTRRFCPGGRALSMSSSLAPSTPLIGNYLGACLLSWFRRRWHSARRAGNGFQVALHVTLINLHGSIAPVQNTLTGFRKGMRR